mgnify:CR=1 FL=1
MSNIIEIKKTVVQFLKENINSYDVTVIKIEKVNDVWEAEAEVYEDDSFLKSMNLPPKKVRLFYSVRINANLEITSFGRLSSYEEMNSTYQ